MSEREYKKIIAVDEQNENPIAVTYEEANEQGLMKRAARVFLINQSGQILIQKRSRHISKPLLLDNSAAGHVDEGEEYIEAAIRELYEELGVAVNAEELQKLPMVKEVSFFAQNYLLRVSDSIKITPDPYEVDSYYWYSRSEIDTLVAAQPEACSPSLVEIWPQIRDSISL